jgi:hypothetical protein
MNQGSDGRTQPCGSKKGGRLRLVIGRPASTSEADLRKAAKAIYNALICGRKGWRRTATRASMNDPKFADKAERRQPTETPPTESATPKATNREPGWNLTNAQEEAARLMGVDV